MESKDVQAGKAFLARFSGPAGKARLKALQKRLRETGVPLIEKVRRAVEEARADLAAHGYDLHRSADELDALALAVGVPEDDVLSGEYTIGVVRAYASLWLQKEKAVALRGRARERLGLNKPPNAAVFCGNGLYRVGDESIRLEGQEALVLEALVELRAGSKSQLEDQSGVSDAVPVLRRIRRKFPALASAISLPGGKGRGGYSTTIRPE